MITEEDKIFITNNYDELLKGSKGFEMSPGVMQHLKTRYYSECWICNGKRIANIRNLLNEYERTTNRNIK